MGVNGILLVKSGWNKPVSRMSSESNGPKNILGIAQISLALRCYPSGINRPSELGMSGDELPSGRGKRGTEVEDSGRKSGSPRSPIQGRIAGSLG